MKNFFLITFFVLYPFYLYGGNENLENRIYKNLRWLVCQGQSISESNSDFSQSIKLSVKQQISEGKNEQEIYKYLSSKYGDWILYKPSFNIINSFLWILPYVFLIIGAVFILAATRKQLKK